MGWLLMNGACVPDSGIPRCPILDYWRFPFIRLPTIPAIIKHFVRRCLYTCVPVNTRNPSKPVSGNRFCHNWFRFLVTRSNRDPWGGTSFNLLFFSRNLVVVRGETYRWRIELSRDGLISRTVRFKLGTRRIRFDCRLERVRYVNVIIVVQHSCSFRQGKLWRGHLESHGIRFFFFFFLN